MTTDPVASLFVGPSAIKRSMAMAADAIRHAGSVLITAGAGFSVDSGLPDYRGAEGFWRAYPPLAALGLCYEEMSTPHWFFTRPALAWGFHGHCMALYRQTAPHEGYLALRAWSEPPLNKSTFVLTSNIDSAFFRAGFGADRVCELHGSLEHLQCIDAATCSRADRVFSADGVHVTVDTNTMLCDPNTIPRCAHCGAMARPNVDMFDDAAFVSDRETTQEWRLVRWLRSAPRPLVIVEIGAGKAVPTIRHFGESVARDEGAPLVRINVRDADVDGINGAISIPLRGLEAITDIHRRLVVAAGNNGAE